MVVNPVAFPKYTEILDCNTADSALLPKMIDKLRLKPVNINAKVLVVLDVAIAKEENLIINSRKRL